jgi:hypothetical protein
LISAGASAAVITGSLMAAAPAMAETVNPPAKFHLASCPQLPAADFGRGISLVPGHPHQVLLSTRNNIKLTMHEVQVDPPGANGVGTFYLTYKSRYLRVSATHAWLGTAKQMYASMLGYGDSCGGPRSVRMGLDPAGDEGMSGLVWTGRAKVLRAEPLTRRADGGIVMRQVWDWFSG